MTDNGGQLNSLQKTFIGSSRNLRDPKESNHVLTMRKGFLKYITTILTSSLALHTLKKFRKWHWTVDVIVVAAVVLWFWSVLFLLFPSLGPGLWSSWLSLFIFTAWFWGWTWGARLWRSPPWMLQEGTSPVYLFVFSNE